MQRNDDNDLVEMSSRTFQDLIRNKKNLLAVFTLKGTRNKGFIFLHMKCRPWSFLGEF